MLWLALGLAACSRGEREEAQAPSPLAEEELPEAPDGLKALPIGARAPIDIEGEWRLAGIDDVALDLPRAITASITEDRIMFRSDCVVIWRFYRLVGTDMSMPPPPDADRDLDNPEQYPPPSCLRPHDDAERAIQSALVEADTAYRLPDQSLVLEGPGGSLTLYTQ